MIHKKYSYWYRWFEVFTRTSPRRYIFNYRRISPYEYFIMLSSETILSKTYSSLLFGSDISTVFRNYFSIYCQAPIVNLINPSSCHRLSLSVIFLSSVWIWSKIYHETCDLFPSFFLQKVQNYKAKNAKQYTWNLSHFFSSVAFAG